MLQSKLDIPLTNAGYKAVIHCKKKKCALGWKGRNDRASCWLGLLFIEDLYRVQATWGRAQSGIDVTIRAKYELLPPCN